MQWYRYHLPVLIYSTGETRFFLLPDFKVRGLGHCIEAFNPSTESICKYLLRQFIKFIDYLLPHVKLYHVDLNEKRARCSTYLSFLDQRLTATGKRSSGANIFTDDGWPRTEMGTSSVPYLWLFDRLCHYCKLQSKPDKFILFYLAVCVDLNVLYIKL